MKRSRRPGCRDLRSLYLLIGECRELGADPVAWRARLLEGLLPLIDAACGACFGLARIAEPGPANGSMALTVMVDSGLADANVRRVYREIAQAGVEFVHKQSAFPVRAPDAFPSVTRTRRQLIDDRSWYGSDFVREQMSLTGLDDFVGSESLTSPSSTFSLGGHRIVGGRPFARRERLLLRLCVADLLPLLGTRLAAGTAPSIRTLAPRMRQVLLCLFEGDGEKQVAARLRISPHTVHEYLRRLHRHFDVSSRGELLARCASLVPLLRALDSGDESRG